MMRNNTDDKDQELLLQVKAGSAKAFETLYQQYYGMLYLHAWQKIQDREVAKDIVQDVFTNIWQKRTWIDVHTKFSSYLYQSVKNRILDFISKQKYQQKYLDSLDTFLDSHAESADTLLRERMLAEQIEETLARLPNRVREIFELSRNSYLTHKEIAEKLNISEHTVRGYVKEALRALKHKLGSLLWALLLLYVKHF